MRYDVNNLKWEQLPSMKRVRKNPGCFMTRDKTYLYMLLKDWNKVLKGCVLIKNNGK